MVNTIIERYQSYLDQLSTKNDSSLGQQIYYDPRLPSLYRVISDFYTKYRSESTNLTCYQHLECNRGISPPCLDWTEICDGKIDCLDGNFDEEHCWKLEINQCKDNEYRCMNGQCIPKVFYHDEEENLNCIDGSDINRKYRNDNEYKCNPSLPFIACDDIKCDSTYLTSSSLIDVLESILSRFLFKTVARFLTE